MDVSSKTKKAKEGSYNEWETIPDYERPVLEKYQKSDFTPSDPRDKTKLTKVKTPFVMLSQTLFGCVLFIPI